MAGNKAVNLCLVENECYSLYSLSINNFNGLPTSSVLFSGTTNNINFVVAGSSGPLYGTSRNLNQVGIVYTGFFSPPVTGVYTLNITGGDDVAYLWMGTPASASTCGQTNYLERGTYFSPNIRTVSQNFFYGQLYPIVLLMANGAGDAVLQLSITTPAGVVVTDTTGYFLQSSCGGAAIPTATNQPTQTAVCAATGIQYMNRPAPTTAPFNPDNYSPATVAPYNTFKFRGVTDDIAFGVPSPGTSVLVYGHGPFDVTASGTFARGYFVPNITGSYTFSLNQPDDVGYMWLGPTAISGWTAANSQIRAATVSGASGVYTTTLTAGVLTPIRLAFGNAGGAMSYTLTVRDPNGLTKGNTFGEFLMPWCGGVAQYSNWT